MFSTLDIVLDRSISSSERSDMGLARSWDSNPSEKKS